MQNKFKWHDEVIAWLNGETIQFKHKDDNFWQDINLKKNCEIPSFYTDSSYKYRIKPNEVIMYAGICKDSLGAEMSEIEHDSLDKAIKFMKLQGNMNLAKFQKRTYHNGELIELELVKV